jgi:amino acid adenylation domain-containing protein
MSSSLAFLAIPTALRPVELRRAVSSFADHLKEHRCDVPIVIFHSPRRAAEQDEVQAAVRAGSAEAIYVGLSQKLTLAKELRRISKVPPELLDLALFDPLKAGVATGANRNAALLWAAGKRFLSCDDDITAEFFAHPASQPGAVLQPCIASSDPCDYFVPADEAYRLHVGDPRLPSGGLPSALTEIWDAAKALGTPAPLVFLGLSGDCGWAAPFGFYGVPLGYLQLAPSTLTRLATTRERWREVVTSRSMLRVVSRPQLSRGAPGMSFAVGIDASEELPPFVPVGRGQDLIFCSMVERLRGAPSVHLPLAVAHRPPSGRRFREGELWRAASSLDLCRTFFALLEILPAGSTLAELGRFLEDAAAGDFEGVVRAGWRLQADRLCGEARRYVEANRELPLWWRDDLLSYCDRTEQVAASDEPLQVLDAGSNDSAESIARARLLVQRYGALCGAWPALLRAARDADRPLAAKKHSGHSELVYCSPYQTWLWRLHRLDPANTSNVIFCAVQGESPLDAMLLEQALRALTERHLALRCRLPPGPDDEPLLELRPSSEVALLREGPFTTEEALAAARQAERFKPFDLVGGLPLRATLVEGKRWELWLSFHHAAFDGESLPRFWYELETIYQNLLVGASVVRGLSPLKLDYRAVAQRQRAALTPEAVRGLEEHWSERLKGVSGELRVSYREFDPATGAASRHLKLSLHDGSAMNVHRLARERRTSIAALALAAWQAVLSRFSGERDVLVGVPFANRLDEVEQEQIGLFMSVLPVRADLKDDLPLLELADAARQELALAWKYGRLPFDRLVRSLGRRRQFTLIHAMFTHEVAAPAPKLAGAEVSLIELEEKETGFDVGLTVIESADRIYVHLSGNAGLFDRGDLQRLGDAFASCLDQVCRDPALRLSQIDWLSKSDETLLSDWNRTDADFPRDVPLTALLREHATSRTIALESTEEILTYCDLHQRANALASRLRARGVDRDAVVGVYLDRHAWLLVSLLGVLEAGGAYLPLDPGFPRNRLAFMLKDSGVRVLVTRRAMLDELPRHNAEVICVDDEELPLEAPAGWLGPNATSLAYVLYTSGSTGKPKGVEIEHRALVNFLCSMSRRPGFQSGAVLLALTTLSFDIAGLEWWLPLFSGGTVALAGRDEAADGARLAAALARSRATTLQATPSTWRLLFASGWKGNPELSAMVGGEVLPVDLAQRLAGSCGEAWNLYGPTETTIWSAAWQIPHGTERVRIGRPIANTQLRVLDEQRRQLPLGVTGELWISGEGVARGYRGRPELTAERFFADPFRPGGRIYRTGDLARWLPNGELEFLGRTDDQIKLRGYRIAPGEIEATLHLVEEIGQAAVDLHHQGTDDDRLVAYVVPKIGTELPSSAELRRHLREHLADYLVPHHFIEVERLPLTPNGKVDRKRLDSLFKVVHEEPPAASEYIDPLGKQVVAEFGAILDAPVGPDTDFFEAGGDSLTALQLVNRLRMRHGALISGGDVFVHATPRKLAARLRATYSRVKGRHLLRLREGTGAPIVFVHRIGGDALAYLPLAQRLNSRNPVFAFQAVAGEAPFASLEERCAAYAEELQQTFSGPLCLCGHSLGGLLAMQLAAQLSRAGREVRWVFLLDAWVPRSRWARMRKRFAELWQQSWSERWRWVCARQWVRPTPRRLPNLDGGERLMMTFNEQIPRWVPSRYEGNVMLFRCDLNMFGPKQAPDALGWDKFCSKLTVLSVPGNHLQILNEPTVSLIVKEIEARLH